MYPVGGNPGSLSRHSQFTYASSYQTTPALARGSPVGTAGGTITPAQSGKRLVGWRDSPPASKSDRIDAYKRRIDTRGKTVEERLNPAMNKKVRSFLRNDGTVKYIERPCEFCERLGKKDQWHFSFECGNKSSVTALILETPSSDSEYDILPLPGVRPSVRTSAPTSYVFSTLGKD